MKCRMTDISEFKNWEYQYNEKWVTRVTHLSKNKIWKIKDFPEFYNLEF